MSASFNRKLRRTIYAIINNPKLSIIYSDELLDEYSSVISRAKFQAIISKSQANCFIQLVFVHWFSVPSYILDSTFRSATQRGYATLRYDNFGRGNSDNPDAVYDVTLFANQLRELLCSLKIIKPITLLGLSDGGRTISAFAAQFPARILRILRYKSQFKKLPIGWSYLMINP